MGALLTMQVGALAQVTSEESSEVNFSTSLDATQSVTIQPSESLPNFGTAVQNSSLDQNGTPFPETRTTTPVTGYVSPRQSMSRRGPYYPAALDAALPFPEPVFPELAVELQLVIRLSERRVYLYNRDNLQVSYPIAVGRAGWETPVGSYSVINMVVDPGWQNPFTGAVIPPGPSNPLGDRWIGFWTDGENFIGFHGTPNEGSVGRAASHGCIRMYNRDVRELFEKVAVGTPVIVQP